LEQLGNHVGHAVVLADVVDGQDVGMTECGGGTRFLLEALEPFRIAGNSGRENFNRDIPTEPSVSGTIHLASCADKREDLVSPETNAGRK
jgi:hypothetical protein